MADALRSWWVAAIAFVALGVVIVTYVVAGLRPKAGGLRSRSGWITWICTAVIVAIVTLRFVYLAV